MFGPPFIATEVSVEGESNFAPLSIAIHRVSPSADVSRIIEYQGVRFPNVQCDGVVPLAIICRADLYQVVAEHVHPIATSGGPYRALRLRA